MIANKIDRQNYNRSVSRIEGEEYAQRNGMDFYAISAQVGTNVDECFSNIIQKLISEYGLRNTIANETTNNIETNNNETNDIKHETTNNMESQHCHCIVQ